MRLRPPASIPSAPPCQRCAAPLEATDLRCALCGLATPVPEESDEGPRLQIRIHRCKGCGSAVEFDPQAQAPRCGFCDEVMEVETLHDPPEEIEEHLPFRVSSDQAKTALQSAFARLGFFRPADVAASARIQEIEPLWWVAWSFDGAARVSWAADSNAGARRSDWAPHAGQLEIEFADVVVSASRGLSDEETETLAPHYDLASAAGGLPDRPGATIERFDVSRSQARQRILQAVDAESAARVQAQAIPGTKFRNVHTSALLRELSTRRLALPAWVLVYNYRDRPYRAVVHGQRPEAVRMQAPISWARVALVVGLALVALFLLFLGVTG